MLVANVIVDIATKELDTHFDYLVPDGLTGVEVGSCVLVNFANRMAVGYVVGLASASAWDRLKPVEALLGGPYFGPAAPEVARWIAEEYVCPLSEALRLFTPPGGTPRAAKIATVEVVHDDTLEHAYLRRRKADAGRLVHDRNHLAAQVDQVRLGGRIDRGSGLLEYGTRMRKNFHAKRALVFL